MSTATSSLGRNDGAGIEEEDHGVRDPQGATTYQGHLYLYAFGYAKRVRGADGRDRAPGPRPGAPESSRSAGCRRPPVQGSGIGVPTVRRSQQDLGAPASSSAASGRPAAAPDRTPLQARFTPAALTRPRASEPRSMKVAESTYRSRSTGSTPARGRPPTRRRAAAARSVSGRREDVDGSTTRRTPPILRRAARRHRGRHATTRVAGDRGCLVPAGEWLVADLSSDEPDGPGSQGAGFGAE